MADDMKRVGLVFKADGTQEFKASIKEINATMQQNRAEFKLAKSAYDENTTSTKKLMDEQKYLTSQTQAYTQKVGILQEELNQLESAENRDEAAIKKKKTQLSNTQTTLNNYKNSLANVETQLKNGSAQMENYEKQLDKTNTSIKENETNFKLAQSEWTKSTSVTQKLKDEQKYLSDQTQAYTEKQKLLKSELETLNSAEEKNEQAIREKKQQLAETETALNNYKTRLDETNTKLKTGTEQLSAYSAKLDEFGTKTSDLGKTATTNLTTPIVALTTASQAAWSQMDEGYDTVVTKTGATGTALEGLQKSMDNVFKDLPTSAQDAGIAVGEVNTRFGVTGKELEKLSTLFIEFAQINETDLNNAIGTTDKILTQWNIDASDTEKVLGLITAKAQETGISVDTLMSSVQTNGATFKEMGLNLQQSITLLGEFEKNGVNADIAIAGLKKAVKNYTDEGMSMDEALGTTIESIKSAKSETEALSIAQEIFGTKGAAEMTKAIREGRFSVDDLSASLNGYSDTVTATFEGTKDPIDDAKTAWNGVVTEVGKLGGSIGEVLYPMLVSLAQKIEEITQHFNSLDEGQKETIIKIAAIVAAIGPLLIGFGSVSKGISSIIGLVSTVKGLGIGAKIASLGSTIGNGLVGAISGIKTAATGLFSVIAANPVIAIIAAIVIAVVALYAKCEWFRDGVNAIFGTIGGFLSGAVSTAKQKLGEMKAAYEENGGGIKGVVAALMTGIEGIFSDTYQIINNLTGGKLEECKTAIQSKLTDAKNICSEKLGEMKTAYEENGGGIKGAMAAAMTGVKSIVSGEFAAINYLTGGKLGEMLSLAETKLGDLQKKFTNKISDIRQTVSNGVDKLKSIFNFDWSLPKIKLPHFKINGGFSLNPPKVPSFDVSWYANGGILNKPTIFGAASNGRLLGGGEAGKEAVAPLDTLMSYIRTANSESNEQLISSLSDVMCNAVYTALIKAIQTLKPEIILDDEKVGDFVLELLRKEVFA